MILNLFKIKELKNSIHLSTCLDHCNQGIEKNQLNRMMVNSVKPLAKNKSNQGFSQIRQSNQYKPPIAILLYERDRDW